MKRRWLGGIAAAFMTLTGCSIPQSNVDNLLVPPLLNEEQNEIYSALVQETGNDIKLLYPQKGENRSAFLIINLDEEVTSEAVAFYQFKSPNIPAEIHMTVLDKKEEEWQSVYDIGLDGIQVEDVSVMKSETGPLLAVGLAYSSGNTSLLKVYRFDGSAVNEICSEQYQAKSILDMDGDDQDDIILVTAPNIDGWACSRLLTYQKGRFYGSEAVLMDPGVTRYGRITSGYLKNGKKALYLDAYCGSTEMTTEILSYQDGELVNLTYHAEDPVHYPVDRGVGSFCADLNGDSIIEVPGQTLMPGYTREMSSVFYLTDWYHFLNGAFTRIKSSYVNYSQGYMLDFPEKWIGKVSVKKTFRGNETLFYEYSGENSPIKQELLYIQMVKRNDWLEGRYPGYLMIDNGGGGQIVYLARIPEKVNSPYAVNITEVKKNFNRYY